MMQLCAIVLRCTLPPPHTHSHSSAGPNPVAFRTSHLGAVGHVIDSDESTS